MFNIERKIFTKICTESMINSEVGWVCFVEFHNMVDVVIEQA